MGRSLSGQRTVRQKGSQERPNGTIRHILSPGGARFSLAGFSLLVCGHPSLIRVFRVIWLGGPALGDPSWCVHRSEWWRSLRFVGSFFPPWSLWVASALRGSVDATTGNWVKLGPGKYCAPVMSPLWSWASF